MSKVIKHIYEAFNFGSVNNQKTPLNVVNTVLTPILYKIHNFEKLSDDEYNILISYTGIYKVSDKDELEKIIEYFIKRFGNECNLNWIDVKNVTNMRNLFYYQQDFNGDISKWDVSNVTNMELMFNYSKFDGDISNWDVSNVTNMKGMFEESIFNGDISLWNVSNVTDMSYMFCGAHYFYSNINEWDVSNVRNMEYMFNESNFGLSFMSIDEWDVSNVTNMCCMFARTDFNKDISDWDVSNVTNMCCMFAESNFNQNISNWNINPNCNTDEMFDTCAIEDRYMPKLPKKQTKVNESFEFTSANNQKAHINIYDELPVIKERLDNFKELENYQYHILTTIPSFYKVENISLLKKLIPYFIGQFGNDCNLNWIDTSNITDMYALFMSTEFNGDISKWDVSNVTIMSLMFANSKFNGDIRGWDVSKVSDMSSMFNMSKFNKDISKWDVSNVVNMRRMFYNAEFNGDISRWDISNVITMEGMFAYSKFNGDITGWRPSVEDNVNMHNMFLSCDMKKTPLWYTEDRPVMEAFDFNSVTDKKSSITANIKRISEDVIKNEVLPLFNNLRPDYVERCKFIPDYRFIGNKCELLYQNKVIIDFTFGLEYIDVMNIYDTTRLNIVNFNGYIQDISVIFYIVRLIPIPINSLNFCYDSSKYPAYKLEGSMGHDELIDLTRIMEDYTDKLPEHITFNSKYIDLYNLRFENENAIKKFIYKLRKDNGEQKYEIKQCIFITETPPEFRGLLNTPRCKGTTSKLIRKYIKAPVNTLLEGFNFDSVNKGKPKLNIFEKIYKILETPINKLSEDDMIFIKSMKDSMPPFKVNTKEELENIISQATKLFGNKCDLNWIDVSSITDMSNIFAGNGFDKKYNIFNGDISLWNVSNVTDMSGMFRASMFNGDISLWDVSNVTNMSRMFENSKFNGDISNWNVSNVTNMFDMFEYSEFNGDISNWDVRNVKDMYSMFAHSNFNSDISNWNINNVTDRLYMFDKCKIKNIYKPKKKKKVEEGFDFDSIDKKKILPSLSMKDKVLLFDNFLKDLYDKHVLTGMQYGNKYFSDAWSKAKSDLEFNGTYYKCEATGDHLNVELNYMNLYFQSPENYNQFCEDIKIFKDIRINGLLSIYMKTLSLRMQRLENFGELGKTITFVKELDINNLILHDFAGMPEVESFKANRTTIFTFNHFKYNDSVNNIELYYKPGQHCVIDWTGFPKKIYGLFSYTLDTDIDSTPGGYIIAFQKQLTTFKGFPEDFMFVTNPTNIMKVGQPNFIDINMPKWLRDQIKEHIMDILLLEFPNKQKRDKLYKRLTKIYRYR